MNQQPDRFFREKLENFQIPAPPAAWQRVDNNLNKKNSTPLFLKVAASLLFMMAATALVWSLRKGDDQQIAQSTKQTSVNPKEKDTLPLVSGPNPDKKAIPPIEKKRPVFQTAKKPAEQKSTRRAESISDNILLATGEKPRVLLVEFREPVIIPRVVTASSREDGGVTLFYSLEEVNEKYLDKKALAEATSHDKNSSTLKKLLEKAYDLKHNQDPFGSLRQKKNEILALNFRNDKQRSQNK